MFEKTYLKLLTAMFQVGPPTFPAGIAFTFFGIDIRNRQQDARLLDIAEIGIRYRIETRIEGDRFM